MFRPTAMFRGALSLSVWLGFIALASAGEVPGFGGVTSPHSNENPFRNLKLKGKGILPVGIAEPKTESSGLLSGSIYYMVFERDGRSADDPWGTGGPQFTSRFRPGIDFNGSASPSLDINAKYLYLYQVVNHQRTDPTIESASIKLLADLSDITSWGYFQGMGFATEEDHSLRPISANYKLDPNTYRSPAPAVPINRSLRLALIPTTRGEEPAASAGKLVRVHWDAFDPARTPDYVMLLARSDFDENSSFRAIWSGSNAIAKDGRSTVFGFTTNLPPKLDQARLRTSREFSKGVSEITPVALDKEVDKDAKDAKETKDGKTKLAANRDSIVGIEGQAPTPIPAAPQSTGIALASTAGQENVTRGAPPFPALFPPAMPPASVPVGGGGFPLVVSRQMPNQIAPAAVSFFGSGSSSGTAAVLTSGNVNIAIGLNQSQSQQQMQGQFQGQSQGQQTHQGNGPGPHGNGPWPHGPGAHGPGPHPGPHGPPGNVVPEPATILGGSVGLIALLGWARRRQQLVAV